MGDHWSVGIDTEIEKSERALLVTRRASEARRGWEGCRGGAGATSWRLIFGALAKVQHMYWAYLGLQPSGKDRCHTWGQLVCDYDKI